MSRYLSPKEKRIKKQEDTNRQNSFRDYMSHTKPDKKAEENFRRKPYHVGGDREND